MSPDLKPTSIMKSVAQSREQPVEHLTDEDKKLIDEWVAKFPPEKKSSAVIPSLLLVQKHHHGWLTNSLLEEVADYLSMSRIAVYEVATFYSMLELKPVGEHKICVCTNVSCMLRGSAKIVKHLEKRLGIPMGETTPDGKFTLKEVECLASCVTAPMMQIGDDYYENLTTEKVDQILEKFG